MIINIIVLVIIVIIKLLVRILVIILSLLTLSFIDLPWHLWPERPGARAAARLAGAQGRRKRKREGGREGEEREDVLVMWLNFVKLMNVNKCQCLLLLSRRTSAGYMQRTITLSPQI